MISIICWWATERSRTLSVAWNGSRNSSMIPCAIRFSALKSISRVFPAGMPSIKMFSATVRNGTTCRS